MTIRDQLTHSPLKGPTAQLDTELLICHVLNCERGYLISHDEQELSEEQLNELNALFTKRQEGTPIAYLIGKKAFYGRDFMVDERVLIPRPETEEMLEDAFTFLRQNPDVQTIIDLGTGSGCLAITTALEFPDRKVYGLEISPDALEVARKNHETHGCPQLELIQSDLLTELPDLGQEPVLILANLPYIGTETNHFVSDETEAYEPHVALFGGSDGLELYRQTWQQIHDKKLHIGMMTMEMGFSQADQIMEETQKAFPPFRVELKADLAGLPRTVILSDPKRAA